MKEQKGCIDKIGFDNDVIVTLGGRDMIVDNRCFAAISAADTAGT